MSKLVGITTNGTYYSPWFPYGLASFYHACDEIVVVNGGYDLNNPDENEYNVPLKQVSDDIKRLDVNGKVHEITGFTLDDLKHSAVLATQIDHPEDKKWWDMRAVGVTLANEKAVELGADWIIKWDSDQVGYEDCKTLNTVEESITLYQYEFCQDIYHLCDPGPEPHNDSVFTYPADPGSGYYEGMGPHLPGAQRKHTDKYHCAHLRHANPNGLSQDEKLEHFFGRIAFRIFTNEYGEWSDNLLKDAKHRAEQLLNRGENIKTSHVPPPEVTTMDPLEYIEGR